MGELHDLSVARREKEKARKKASFDRIARDLVLMIFAITYAFVTVVLILRQNGGWDIEIGVVVTTVVMLEAIIRLLQWSDRQQSILDSRETNSRQPPPAA